MTRVTHIQPTATCGNPPESNTVVYAGEWEYVGWGTFTTSNNLNHSAIKTPSPLRGGLGRGFFGEPFIEQRSVTEYYTPYTFSAKERDLETGYSYFGARYYDAGLSVWLSVDPMAHERSWLSPYNYCQWNPMVLVDPTGMLDGWYEDENGNAVFNKDINSQQDLDNSGINGEWIGETAHLYCPNTNRNVFGDSEGNIIPYATLTPANVWSMHPDILNKDDFTTIAQLPKILEYAVTGSVKLGKFAWQGIKKLFTRGGAKAAAKGISNGLSKTISGQKQLRHLAGTAENAKNGGGFMNSVTDAQAVLDAVHSGKATFLGANKAGFPVYRFNGVTGTNVNAGAGITGQPTNVFIIKGTTSPSVVPTNPFFKP